MTALSLKNIDEREKYRIVNTPKSLEACFREGIQPEELLYAPFEEFIRPNMPKRVQQMNYEFYESQRIKLLKAVKAQYEKIENNKGKPQRSISNFDLSSLINNETQRLQEKKFKHISKLVNYKIDCLGFHKKTESLPNANFNSRIIITAKQQSEDFDEKSPIYDMKRKLFKGSELKFDKKLFSASVKNFNSERDTQLLANEKKELERNLYYEKQRNLYIEKSRKIQDERLNEHILKVKQLKEQENQEKLEKLSKKAELADQNIKKNSESKTEKWKKKFFHTQDRYSKVISTKLQYDEYLKDIRDLIVKEENEKITAHEKNKKKIQEEIKLKIINKNKQRDEKSKKTREEIERKYEGLKKKKNKELKEIEERIKEKKNKQAEEHGVSREKNKLKEIEACWNIERANRKEEFAKNEILHGIESSNSRVRSLQTAKEYMKRYRYEIKIQTETQKLQIDNALYQMEVKKKLDMEKLKEIITDEHLQNF